MSGTPPDEVAAFVAAELEAVAHDSTRDWWTRYLKGEAEFRGVKMAGTRKVARAVDERFGLDERPMAEVLAVADRLFGVATTEDKLCAVLVLAEHHLDRLTTDDVDRLAGPLARSELADWNSCDWYCVKVLGPFVEATDTERRAHRIAAWAGSQSLWQRRAAAVTFVGPAGRPPPFDGFHDLVIEVCRRNVTDPTRWSQTSAGWLLRELSGQAPGVVAAFVGANADRMSNEARKAATARLR